MAGINISNQGFCTTNIVPDDSIWKNLGNNYILELDMKFVRGTDHNIAFRFTESTTNNKFYEVHFQSPGDFVLGGISAGNYNTYIGRSYPNGQTYHLKITVNKNNISVEIDGNLVRDFTSNIDILPSGRIALRAGTGADRNSETYFDNITVTSNDNTLPVPYYSQNASPWGPTEYDNASLVSLEEPTMDRWGCAVTSAAMVLNYHGMTQFADGTKIDPGTLNQWLKNNNGYTIGKSSKGPFAYILWPAISKLSQELFDAGKSQVKLEHKREYPSPATDSLIKDDLTVQKIPDILQVISASTSGHFVVATGIAGNGYALNDPEWNVPDLSSFGDKYYQLDRYVPSQTNLSYLVIVSNPNAHFLLTNSNGQKVGSIVQNGQTQQYNEITDASYAVENPISNPNTAGTMQQLGGSSRVLLYRMPTDDTYILTISGAIQKDYDMSVIQYQQDGKDTKLHVTGLVNQDAPDTYSLNVSQTQPASLTRSITIDDVINDLNEAKKVEYIQDNSMYKHLLMLLTQVKADILRNRQEIQKRIVKNLNKFEEQLLIMKKARQINDIGYQLLLDDITLLRQTL